MAYKNHRFALLDWPELVEAARSGCDDALGEIITRLRGYLLLIANGQISGPLQSKFGASDIVQNSLIDAHAAIDQFNGTTEAEMRAWLKRIVLHNFIDEKRRYTDTQSRSLQRERSMDSLVTPLASGLSGGGDETGQKPEDLQQLTDALQRLPPRQQRVIEARRRFGYTYQEIADQLEITEGAVRKLWSRAIKQLKEYLNQEE
jgi:RNA polymerase sigma-70 factor (ECF subfamily)